jgi:hypothetical protein
MRAYLGSLLVRQLLVLKDRWQSRYPHAWLIWEPGPWNVPAGPPHVTPTRLPQKAAKPKSPAAGDPLCFELLPPREGDRLTLGRSAEASLVVDDATVSRLHCTLTLAKGSWVVRPFDAAKSLTVAGKLLASGGEAALRSPTPLLVGEVQLTFVDPAGMKARLAALAP